MALVGMDSYSYRLHLEDLDHPRDPFWFVQRTIHWRLGGCSFNPKHLRGWDDELIRGVGEACCAYDLYLELTTSGSDYARLCRRLILAAEVNARILRTSISETRFATSDDHRRALLQFALDNLRRLAEVAECVGVVLALDCQGDLTTEEIISTVQTVGSRHVRASFSNAECLKAGEDPVESAAALAPYLAGALLADCSLSSSGDLPAYEGCVLGDGRARAGEVYRVLRQSRPEMPITLQVSAGEPGGVLRTLAEEDERVCRSVDFVRSLEQNPLLVH